MKKICPCTQIPWYKVLLNIFYFKNTLGSLIDFAWVLEVLPNLLLMGDRGSWIYQAVLQIGVQKIMTQSNNISVVAAFLPQVCAAALSGGDMGFLMK